MTPSTPPSGPPWDLPPSEAPVCFVDLEMTGLNASIDHVVEVCVERWVGTTRVGGMTSLIHPPGRLGGAAHIHGLDATALAGAPQFYEVADEIATLLDGGVFVAHAAEWDARFLNAEFSRMGRAAVVEHYVDTLTLARRAFAFPRYSLDALAAQFNLERGAAHRAEDDVRMLREVFVRCADALRPVSMRDLWEVRVGEQQARSAILSACEGAAESNQPVQVTYRPTRKAPESFPFVIQAIRSDLDPPRVIGYQLPSRGRRELRADRILRVEPSSGEPL